MKIVEPRRQHLHDKVLANDGVDRISDLMANSCIYGRHDHFLGAFLFVLNGSGLVNELQNRSIFTGLLFDYLLPLNTHVSIILLFGHFVYGLECLALQLVEGEELKQ